MRLTLLDFSMLQVFGPIHPTCLTSELMPRLLVRHPHGVSQSRVWIPAPYYSLVCGILDQLLGFPRPRFPHQCL